MKKDTKALIFNILIIIMEVFALISTIRENGRLALEFYTIDSNLLALLTSTLFVIFHKKNSNWLSDAKYISTCCLALTFLVVIFILTPFADFRYDLYMFKGTMLFHHTLCPIFAILSYILYEKRSKKTLLCLSFTFIYTIILIILNIMDIVVGPYFFLNVKNLSILSIIFWFIIIYLINYIIGLFLTKINNKAGAN